jgi:hypothetical protein
VELMNSYTYLSITDMKVVDAFSDDVVA